MSGLSQNNVSSVRALAKQKLNTFDCYLSAIKASWATLILTRTSEKWMHWSSPIYSVFHWCPGFPLKRRHCDEWDVLTFLQRQTFAWSVLLQMCNAYNGYLHVLKKICLCKEHYSKPRGVRRPCACNSNVHCAEKEKSEESCSRSNEPLESFVTCANINELHIIYNEDGKMC